jgi:hypothetical protein
VLTRGTTDDVFIYEFIYVFIYKHNQEIKRSPNAVPLVNAFNISSMDEKRKLSIRRYTVAT